MNEPHEKASCWIGAKLFFTDAVSFFRKLNLICFFFIQARSEFAVVKLKIALVVTSSFYA